MSTQSVVDMKDDENAYKHVLNVHDNINIYNYDTATQTQY